MFPQVSVGTIAPTDSSGLPPPPPLLPHTHSLVVLCTRTKETTEQLRHFETASPAVRLLSDYMLRCNEDIDMDTRMKVSSP